MDWKGYQEEEELKQAEKKYGKNMYDLLFVNEWTCLLALFGQIFKNTNIRWIQFSFYQYIKCLKKNTVFSLQTLLIFLWEYCILCKILCCKNIWILSANIY